MATKKTPAKKAAPKQVAKKVSSDVVKKNVEKTLAEVKTKAQQEAKFIQAESKVLATGVSKWWNSSSTEEKVYTLLGITLLVWGLYYLKGMLWGMLLVIVGILFVTGYFVKKGK